MQKILEESAITNFMEHKSTRYQLRHCVLSSALKSYFPLNLSQHCHKSVFSTSESGLFTAFLQISYQVFFLYKLLLVLFYLMLSLFISILLPDRVLLSWSAFFAFLLYTIS